MGHYIWALDMALNMGPIYGLYLWALYMGHYIWAVYMGPIYGPQTWVLYMGQLYGLHIWALYIGPIYGPNIKAPWKPWKPCKTKSSPRVPTYRQYIWALYMNPMETFGESTGLGPEAIQDEEFGQGVWGAGL